MEDLMLDSGIVQYFKRKLYKKSYKSIVQEVHTETDGPSSTLKQFSEFLDNRLIEFLSPIESTLINKLNEKDFQSLGKYDDINRLENYYRSYDELTKFIQSSKISQKEELSRLMYPILIYMIIELSINGKGNKIIDKLILVYTQAKYKSEFSEHLIFEPSKTPNFGKISGEKEIHKKLKFLKNKSVQTDYFRKFYENKCRIPLRKKTKRNLFHFLNLHKHILILIVLNRYIIIEDHQKSEAELMLGSLDKELSLSDTHKQKIDTRLLDIKIDYTELNKRDEFHESNFKKIEIPLPPIEPYQQFLDSQKYNYQSLDEYNINASCHVIDTYAHPLDAHNSFYVGTVTCMQASIDGRYIIAGYSSGVIEVYKYQEAYHDVLSEETSDEDTEEDTQEDTQGETDNEQFSLDNDASNAIIIDEGTTQDSLIVEQETIQEKADQFGVEEFIQSPIEKFGGPTSIETTGTKFIGHAGHIFGLSISDDNFYLISAGSDRTIQLWCLQNGMKLALYNAHQSNIWDINFMHYGFTTEGIYFLSASQDKYAKLWNTNSLSVVRIFSGHESDVEVAIFHPNLHYAITGSVDQTIRVWSIATGMVMRVFVTTQGSIQSLCVTKGGQYILSGHEKGVILTHNIDTRELVSKIKANKSQYPITSMGISNDDKIIGVISDNYSAELHKVDTLKGKGGEIDNTSRALPKILPRKNFHYIGARFTHLNLLMMNAVM